METLVRDFNYDDIASLALEGLTDPAKSGEEIVFGNSGATLRGIFSYLQASLAQDRATREILKSAARIAATVPDNESQRRIIQHFLVTLDEMIRQREDALTALGEAS